MLRYENDKSKHVTVAVKLLMMIFIFLFYFYFFLLIFMLPSIGRLPELERKGNLETCSDTVTICNQVNIL